MLTIIDFLKEFQILIAGSLAIGAAWIGARALNKSTKQQIKIQAEHFNKSLNLEKITLGKTLVLELGDTLDKYDSIYYESYDELSDNEKVDKVISAVKSFQSWYGKVPKPLNKVYSNNMHKLGLFEGREPAMIIVAYESQDQLYEKLVEIFQKIKHNPKSLKQIKWDDIELYIDGARDTTQLAIEFIKLDLAEIETKSLK